MLGEPRAVAPLGLRAPPRLEAFPGIRYDALLPRVARIAGGLDLAPGNRVAVVMDNRLDGPALLGSTMGGRRLRAAVLAALRGGARLLHRRCGCRARDSRRRSAPGRARTRRRPRPRRPGDLAPAVHVGHDRKAEGGAEEPCGRPGRRLQPGAPARVPPRRSHTRRDAPLPHHGDSLPARDARRRWVLRPAGPLGIQPRRSA